MLCVTDGEVVTSSAGRHCEMKSCNGGTVMALMTAHGVSLIPVKGTFDLSTNASSQRSSQSSASRIIVTGNGRSPFSPKQGQMVIDARHPP